MARRERSSLLGRFFLASLLWLPVAFLAWYYLAAMLSLPVIWLARAALGLAASGLVHEAIGQPADLHFVTSVAVEYPGTPPGSVAELVVPVNVLKYCWNLPLLLALLFAADERHFSLGRLVLGYLALLPVQAWSVTLEVLKALTLEAGARLQPRKSASAGGSGKPWRWATSSATSCLP